MTRCGTPHPPITTAHSPCIRGEPCWVHAWGFGGGANRGTTQWCLRLLRACLCPVPTWQHEETAWFQLKCFRRSDVRSNLGNGLRVAWLMWFPSAIRLPAVHALTPSHPFSQSPFRSEHTLPVTSIYVGQGEACAIIVTVSLDRTLKVRVRECCTRDRCPGGT